MPEPKRGNRSLEPPARSLDAARKKRGGPAWPSFRGHAEEVGTAAGVTVYVDTLLGAPGVQNANDLLAGAAAIVQQNSDFFGNPGGPVNVIIYALSGATDGTGGADHAGCNFNTGNNIEVDASFGAPNRIAALFEAELSECAMNGQLCGLSTGEALSRWCAAVVSHNALPDFATAPTWAQDGMANWVDTTDPTDQDPDSTGCGMAFLSWLMSKGHPLSRIAKVMVTNGDAGTLAQLYAELTKDAAANAWPTFSAALAALPQGVTSDDPFSALAVPAGAGA